MEYLFLKNKHYILVYFFNNILIVDKYKDSIEINSRLIYKNLKKQITYENHEIKIIFSFAEYIQPYNSETNEKNNFIRLGELSLIYQFPKEELIFLLKKLNFYKYKSVSNPKDKRQKQYYLDNIAYIKLSFGEKMLISLFIQISQKIDKNKLNIIFLDELTLAFHPNWEKKIIKFLKKVFYQNNIHFIFSTHSPFLLSDIPKQNIIFLDTYKEKDIEVKEKKQEVGNCRVVPHDEVFDKKQTFGANIHTLLSDSFFMEDGLMGEFAKDKINEIKEFYEKVKLEKKTDENIEFYKKHKEKFWQIQSIIGEPFLQRVIKNYLDELELLFSDDNTLIEKELADIEKRKVYLESLKNA